MKNFFTSKNESLAQSFAEITFKGLFATLLVGALSSFITWQVASKIETLQKRQALLTLQNSKLEAAIDVIAYGLSDSLECARQPALAIVQDCRNALNRYSANLRGEHTALDALFPNAHFECFVELIVAVESLRKAADEGSGNTPEIREGIDHFENTLSLAISEVAAKFK